MTIIGETLDQRLERRPTIGGIATFSGRGYDWLYRNHVIQADQGCDFDFLRSR